MGALAVAVEVLFEPETGAMAVAAVIARGAATALVATSGWAGWMASAGSAGNTNRQAHSSAAPRGRRVAAKRPVIWSGVVTRA